MSFPNAFGGGHLNENFNLAANILAAALTQQQQQSHHGPPGPPGGMGLPSLMGMPPGPRNWRDQVNRNSQMPPQNLRGNYNRNRGNLNQRNSRNSSSSRRDNSRSTSDAKKTEPKKVSGEITTSPTKTKAAEGIKKTEKVELKQNPEISSSSKTETEPETETKTETENSKSEIKNKNDDEKPKNSSSQRTKIEAPNSDSKTEKSRFRGIDSKWFVCNICNKTMWDGESFDRHLNGKSHQRLMEVLDEQNEAFVFLIRKHIQLLEGRREHILERMRKKANNKMTMDNKSTCGMCDVEVFGTILSHRRMPYHQKLKKYLHPKCPVCDKECSSRPEWYAHSLTPDHLRKMQAKQDSNAMIERLIFDETTFINTFFQVENRNKKNNNNKEEGGDQLEDPKPKSDAELVKPEGKEVEEEEMNLSDEKIADFQIPEYDKSKEFGKSFLKPVNGCFCPLCKKFLHSDTMEAHLKSELHYQKFVEAVTAKKVKAADKVATDKIDVDKTAMDETVVDKTDTDKTATGKAATDIAATDNATKGVKRTGSETEIEQEEKKLKKETE